MKKFFFYIVTLLVCFNMFLIFSLITSNKRVEAINSIYLKSNYKTIDCYDKKNASDSLNFIQLINQNYIFDKNKYLKYIGNKNKTLFVFRYFLSNCPSCIDSLFCLINIFKEKIGNRNILILTNIKDDISFPGNQYNFLEDTIKSLKIPFDDFKKPYFFILDHDNIIKQLYIPELDSKINNFKYVKKIIERFYKK